MGVGPFVQDAWQRLTALFHWRGQEQEQEQPLQGLSEGGRGAYLWSALSLPEPWSIKMAVMAPSHMGFTVIQEIKSTAMCVDWKEAT